MKQNKSERGQALLFVLLLLFVFGIISHNITAKIAGSFDSAKKIEEQMSAGHVMEEAAQVARRLFQAAFSNDVSSCKTVPSMCPWIIPSPETMRCKGNSFVALNATPKPIKWEFDPSNNKIRVFSPNRFTRNPQAVLNFFKPNEVWGMSPSTDNIWTDINFSKHACVNGILDSVDLNLTVKSLSKKIFTSKKIVKVGLEFPVCVVKSSIPVIQGGETIDISVWGKGVINSFSVPYFPDLELQPSRQSLSPPKLDILSDFYEVFKRSVVAPPFDGDLCRPYVNVWGFIAQNRSDEREMRLPYNVAVPPGLSCPQG